MGKLIFVSFNYSRCKPLDIENTSSHIPVHILLSTSKDE